MDFVGIVMLAAAMPGVEELDGERVSRAAYLMVKGSIGEDLTSKEDFTAALQLAGFNPSSRLTSSHWGSTTRQMTYSQFSNITEIQPLPTEDSLLAAFQKLDDKRQGWIVHEDLLLSLTSRGDILPKAVLEQLLMDTRYNRDKKFLYPLYCRAVLDTTSALSQLALEKLGRDEEDFSVNSQTYKVRRKTASPEKTRTGATSAASLATSSPTMATLSPSEAAAVSPEVEVWGSQLRSRGAFYLEGDSVICHQYQLSLPVAGLCRIAVQAEKQYQQPGPLVDVQLYLFDENKRFICRTTELEESGQWVWQGRLEAGRYLALAQTSGARLRRRRSSPRESVALLETRPKVRLTREFREVLEDIYTRVDLDASGTLSRAEFNLFNWRTSGEEVADEEWRVVEDNFPLKDGELTLDGFLTLHQMEAEDNAGDPRELRVTVQAMGYNRALVQDESATFSLSVATVEAGAELAVCGLKSGGLLLEKTVTRCAMEADRSPTRVKGGGNMLVYREVTDHRITFVYQNKAESTSTVQMDLSRSTGALSSRESSVFNVVVPKKCSVIAAHVLPAMEGGQWRVQSTAKIVKN